MKKPSWLHLPSHLPPEPERALRPEDMPIENLHLISFEQAKSDVSTELKDVEKFRIYMQTIRCPVCEKAGLELAAYEKGVDGWECAVLCRSCNSKGVFNSTGFRIVQPLESAAEVRMR